MKTVYRVNTIGCYKPWNSTSEYFLTDKNIFKQIKSCNDERDFYRIMAPNAITDKEHPDYNEEDTLAEWLYTQNEDIKMPYILADEIKFYTE